ncbi:MAG: MATE family efflux transporter [Desulfobacterales bacterium]|nr:MATE family efflux transporter [Desulfobacterales bacterium]
MEKEMQSAWSTWRFIRYITPSVLSIVTISLYMVVDALFISRYAGTLAMAAVSIIMPLFSLCFGVGIMMASGASALVGIELGKGEREAACRHFSLGLLFLLVVGVGIVVGGEVAGWERISRVLGASPALLPLCSLYLKYFIIGLAVVLLQIYFEFFIRLDGKPIWAFYLTLLGGVTNVGLDYLLIVKMGMGIMGASLASAAGICMASAVGVFYFLFHSKTLFFRRPLVDGRFLVEALANGSSEMVTELSSGVKTFVFNRVLLAYAGEPGVAAISILMYLYFLLNSLYIGLSMGVSPLLSVNFGAQNIKKLKELMGYALKLTLAGSLATFAITLVWGDAFISLFTSGRPGVTAMAQEGLFFMSGAFLVTGFNILSTGGFTALNNGKISAVIAFLRSFVFTIGLVLLLPLFMGLKGVWLSLTLAEWLTLIVALWCVSRYKRVYIPQEVLV